MGLIDDIEIPPHIFDQSQNQYKDYDSYVKAFEDAMEQCKNYYTDLQEAIYTIGAYIVNYEHAIDSLGFSRQQLENAQEKAKEITDPNIEETKKNIEENIELNKQLVEHLELKKEKFEKILNTMNEKAGQVVDLNEYLNRQYIWLKG